MADATEITHSSLDPATLCCACDELLGTERPLVTLMCFCKAHTECFLRDLGAKQHTEIPETCPRCRAEYISMDLRDKIHNLVIQIESIQTSQNQSINPCFALNEGSPEFVTDIAKCKIMVKEINKHQKNYASLISSTVKKYKEDTKVMADILKSTRRDAIHKIQSAPCAKAYMSSVSQFRRFVSRMAHLYDFSLRDWIKFTGIRYSSLNRSFYRYNRYRYYNWSLRRKFRYGL